MEITENQKNIFNGLRSIGEEISTFYMDSLKILNDENLGAKPYLLAHMAREIDGGLRDILAPLADKEKLLQDPSLKKRGNAVSILVALDLPLDDPFATQYIQVSSKFAKYAHRRGATKLPRDLTEFIDLWSEYESILSKLLGSFINQLKQIERIVKFETPTKEIFAALKNIFNDTQKERHFYIRLKKASWLEPLYNNGFFSPESILDDILWNQAEYLEFISEEIKKENIDQNNSKLLIEIINEICNYSNNIKKLENYRIWYFLLDILTNLPKDIIPDETIDYIPSFFDTKYENNLQSHSIFKFIYSFFEDENVAIENKDKIEKLVYLVFQISDQPRFKDSSTYETGKHYPVIRSYRLKKACENPQFYSPISKFCPNETIYFVADNLLIYLKAQYASEFWIKSLFHPSEVDKHSYSIETIFSIFLKNSCAEVAKFYPERIVEIIRLFLTKRYNHKHFTKLSFFLFAKSWGHSRLLFFEKLKKNDKNKWFSTSFWSDDLYFLLEEISSKLTSEESIILKKIIDEGSQDKNYYNKEIYLNEFKLRWYSALSTSGFFQPHFEKLSKKLKKTKNQIEPKPNSGITSGSISPIKKDELKLIPINELVNYLKSFDPERSFRGASVEGLAKNLQEVIKEQPELFTNNYKLFLNVPHRHISEIFYALDGARKKDRDIAWEESLNFILKYINQPIFRTDKLQLKNASYKYDYLDSTKSFCRLLSKGMRNDETAFSPELLPLAENIIFKFLDKIVSPDLSNLEKGKLGSSSHAINNINGVIIGALFDLSLRKGRLLTLGERSKKPRWSEREKLIYEKLINQNIQEVYMYLGWHRFQFYFLDYHWTDKQLKLIPKKDIQTIKSYFGCHLLNYSYSDLEYETFKDVYIKAIKENWEVQDFIGESPLETHATIFYVNDHENLEKGEILTEFFQQKDIGKIRNIIHSLCFKFDQYFKEVKPEKKASFLKKLFRVWKLTLDVLEEIDDAQAREMPSLFYLIKYVENLDEEKFNLILRTSKLSRNGRDLDELVKNLNRLKLKGEVSQTGIYVCEIFLESMFKDFYYASVMQKEIIDFIDYMYAQSEEKLTAYANKICNEFAKKGQYFLRELYEKYNP